ncbi:hypothetical protein DFH08DRAFT_815150 [Mycena albidolilacea]|uniref:Uncharacterized protein n=1 Tax=Mycena albidolilacea TaxID=1033008 RepID=A0AAD7EJH0_9AGAR|nr:hypothetical protein DFH08DRAFT_815150 [Mycena albidolilacea]
MPPFVPPGGSGCAKGRHLNVGLRKWGGRPMGGKGRHFSSLGAALGRQFTFYHVTGGGSVTIHVTHGGKEEKGGTMCKLCKMFLVSYCKHTASKQCWKWLKLEIESLKLNQVKITGLHLRSIFNLNLDPLIGNSLAAAARFSTLLSVFLIITAKDRWWLPHGSSTVDYRIPPKSLQKSPTKTWHPPMVQRNPSLPPIASFDELSSSGDTFPSTARQLRCDPYDAFGFAAEDSDVVACRKCGFWSHIACVKPLAYVDSDPDSDAESELSWHNVQFSFRCIKIGEVGTIHMLPELPNETNATWLPAALVDFDLSRAGREYKFEWIPGIVWRTREPENLVFYCSLSQWEELEDVLPLNEDQLGTLRLPGCFSPVTEDADTPDEQLSQLLLLAVPKIAQILATDASHPVLQHFVAHFKETPWNVEASLSWMKRCSFLPSPALEQMLVAPLAALSAHNLMCLKSEGSQKVFGPGCVLLQLLAIQHSLGEPWNLNGDTFVHIESGCLVPSPPLCLQGRNAMWESINPLVRAFESKMTTSQLVDWAEQFKAAHTAYDSMSSLVFYRWAMHSDSEAAASMPAIHIVHKGQPILFPSDLPQAEPQKKRVFIGEDVFD